MNPKSLYVCILLIASTILSLHSQTNKPPAHDAPSLGQAIQSVYPLSADIKWITSPTCKSIAHPDMKWAMQNRKYDKSGESLPYAKDPAVIRFDGRYLMYFSLPPDDKVKQTYGWSLGIAESSDMKNWTFVREIPPLSTFDAKGHCAAGALVWNNRVFLFYQSYGTGANDAICLAWSDDGLNFTPHSQNPIFRPHGDWTCGRAIDAEAYIFRGKLFLYAATRDPKFEIQKIVVATANPDGLRDPEHLLGPDAWTQAHDGSILEPQLPWETKCIEAPTVCEHNDKLFMFYAGGYNNDPQQIGIAQSDDGIHWKRLWLVPFIPNGPDGQWNSSESGHPGIFVDTDGRYYLFFQGNPDKGRTWFLSKVEIGWNNNVPFVK